MAISTRYLGWMAAVGLLAIGISSDVGLHADECGPPPTISIDAVCGQTVVLSGWKERGRKVDIFAEIVPEVSLQLIDTSGAVVAEVKSDPEGRFDFSPVAAGTYRLHSAGPPFLDWPIKITRSNRSCSKRMYAYLGIGLSSCGSMVSFTKPSEIKCSLCEPPHD
jgi:hypothetical protein